MATFTQYLRMGSAPGTPLHLYRHLQLAPCFKLCSPACGRTLTLWTTRTCKVCLPVCPAHRAMAVTADDNCAYLLHWVPPLCKIPWGAYWARGHESRGESSPLLWPPGPALGGGGTPTPLCTKGASQHAVSRDGRAGHTALCGLEDLGQESGAWTELRIQKMAACFYLLRASSCVRGRQLMAH